MRGRKHSWRKVFPILDMCIFKIRNDILFLLNMVVASKVFATSISTQAFMICSVLPDLSTNRRTAAKSSSPSSSSGITSNIADRRWRSGENKTSNRFWYLKSLSRSSGENSFSLFLGTREMKAGGGREGILRELLRMSCFHRLSVTIEGPILTSGMDGGTIRAVGTFSSITVHWPQITVPLLTCDIRIASRMLHCSQNRAAHIRHLLFQRPHKSHSSTPASIGASGFVI
mmetsp:Transcript_49223/g.154477  ORF Transcript_49223/g.154477 Transcript_49223/m.154477 type:complete len:229 (+) Transcript_49223:1427-2113(+)